MIQKVPRQPMSVEIFKLYSEYAKEQNLLITEPGTQVSFSESAQKNIKSSLSKKFELYGRRTEAMFQALVIALGEAKFFKEEDSGATYAEQVPFFIPDFQIGLAANRRFLVEVKNFYQNNVDAAFTISSGEIQGLKNYGEEVGCSVKLAIFWARWALWTLIPIDILRVNGAVATVPLGDAIKANEMGLLGDCCIGVRSPLRMIWDTDPVPIVAEEGEQEIQFTVRDVHLFCQQTEITHPAAKKLCHFLMLYGRFAYDGGRGMFSEKTMVGLEHTWVAENDSKQGFEIIGALSTLFSNYYASRTFDENNVIRVTINSEPGALRQFISPESRSDDFPIWIFTQVQ